MRGLSIGSIQPYTGVSGAVAQSLAVMWKHFPSFSAGIILVSTVQFFNACMLEQETRSVMLHKRAFRFVEYRRGLSGEAEAFVCFIWPVDHFPDPKTYLRAMPDAVRYLNITNDILSFYKEELAGETGTYVHDRAFTTRSTLLQTISQAVNEAIATAERIRKLLGKGAARDAWDSFERGYTTFHLLSPRYRLQEILGGEYMIDLDTISIGS
ncbi:terpenoid synthase [Laetiporus sulphureus 93-53]|uniref:Terpenoid synthase n=1 Tax=Laetiporus sulphureus 93-53 TaxID=1314785 RepID=A0A165BIT4_9APHY|nr:terpenoid synthase [Laetiporus sulphureus 93-53]KZT01137.1 terpenoid synthase [Laetiporus sulphureus 93-53]